MSMPLLQGNKFEWSHVRRHKSEKYFGVQICGNKAETLARTTDLLNQVCDNIDFIDLNCGCPIGSWSTLFDKFADSATEFFVRLV